MHAVRNMLTQQGHIIFPAYIPIWVRNSWNHEKPYTGSHKTLENRFWGEITTAKQHSPILTRSAQLTQPSKVSCADLFSPWVNTAKREERKCNIGLLVSETHYSRLCATLCLYMHQPQEMNPPRPTRNASKGALPLLEILGERDLPKVKKRR